jgi:glycosyltransferase involved in cell wall biosynthesis
VFVYPSLYEGFGIPVLEAMACGCPVVTSNISSLPEVVGQAGMLIDPYNVQELAEALRRVLEDATLAYRLREKGLERAGLFSWQRCAQQTQAIYHQAARL